VLLPSAKQQAADLQVSVDQGKMTPDQAKAHLASRLRAAGMSDSDAEEAASGLGRDATKGTPEERRRAQVQRARQSQSDIDKQAKLALGDDKDPKSLAESMVAESMMRGGNLTRARGQLRDMLKAGGMDEDKIGAAADAMLGKAKGSVEGKVRHEWSRGMERDAEEWRRNSRSTIGDITGMTARVQGGVTGANPTDKLISETNRILAELRDNAKGTLSLKVTP
jgi:hypothetical protein